MVAVKARSTASRRAPLAVQAHARAARSGIPRACHPSPRARAAPHSPRSDADSRSTDWHAATTWSRRLACMPSAIARTGKRARPTRTTAAPTAQSRSHRAANREAGTQLWAGGGERNPLPRTAETDQAASPNPCSRATPRTGGSGASSVRGRPPRLPRERDRRPRSSLATGLRMSIVPPIRGRGADESTP